MKSQRRHELQQNTLAEWLGKVVQGIRPYQTTVLGGVLLLALAAMGVVLLLQHFSGQQAEAARSLFSGNLALLTDLADKQPGTPIGINAAVCVGDQYLAEGAQQRFVNRATANTQLARAVEYYQRVIDSPQSPMLRERATYGLARALEIQGKLADAEQQYEQVVSQWPDGTYAAGAEQRLSDLKRPETKEFYDKFASYDPKPAFSGDKGLPTRSSLTGKDALAEPPEGHGLHDDSPFKGMELEQKEKPREKPTAPPTAEPPKTPKPQPPAGKDAKPKK